jgi:hypothetical protein
MFVNRFFFRYWRYLLTLICGYTIIITSPACATSSRNSGAPAKDIVPISCGFRESAKRCRATISCVATTKLQFGELLAQFLAAKAGLFPNGEDPQSDLLKIRGREKKSAHSLLKF